MYEHKDWVRDYCRDGACSFGAGAYVAGGLVGKVGGGCATASAKTTGVYYYYGCLDEYVYYHTY